MDYSSSTRNATPQAATQQGQEQNGKWTGRHASHRRIGQRGPDFAIQLHISQKEDTFRSTQENSGSTEFNKTIATPALRGAIR
jgi:hypothetical protein